MRFTGKPVSSFENLRAFVSSPLLYHCPVSGSAAPLVVNSPELVPLSLPGPSQIQSLVKAHQEILDTDNTHCEAYSLLNASAKLYRTLGAILALCQHPPAASWAHAADELSQLFSKLGAE